MASNSSPNVIGVCVRPPALRALIGHTVRRTDRHEQHRRAHLFQPVTPATRAAARSRSHRAGRANRGSARRSTALAVRSITRRGTICIRAMSTCTSWRVCGASPTAFTRVECSRCGRTTRRTRSSPPRSRRPLPMCDLRSSGSTTRCSGGSHCHLLSCVGCIRSVATKGPWDRRFGDAGSLRAKRSGLGQRTLVTQPSFSKALIRVTRRIAGVRLSVCASNLRGPAG
jgi:hypothetical protein